MTLDELLAGFKDQYGDTWHLAALDRFLHLHTSPSALPAWSEEKNEEYLLLRQWVEDAVEKSVKAEEER